jgi:hypothetical protein
MTDRRLISRSDSMFLATFVISLLSLPATAVEWTIFQPIFRTQYNGDTQHLYFVGTSGWGSTSCPLAMYVQILPSVPGHKELLALGLAAHASGKAVQFLGDCDAPNGNYFRATYVIMQ